MPDADAIRLHQSYLPMIGEPSAITARAVLPLLLQKFPITSLLDIGCGTGAWLTIAQSLGIARRTGIDAAWAAAWQTADATFITHDLSTPITHPPHDLALCLEVAHYFPEARIPSFVAELCAATPLVLFSAAIPHQYPPHDPIMLTNRWPSWWAAHFAAHRFYPLDIIRPAIWTNDAIPAYYRQNILLYAKDATATQTPLDLVHPECWEHRNHPHSIKGAARLLLRALGRRLGG